MIQSSITPIPSSSGAGGGGGGGGSTSTSPTPASTPSVVAAPVLLKKSGPAAPTLAAPPSPNLPRTSSLTQQEHRLFLDLERRFVQHQQQQGPPLDEASLSKYLEMRHRVFLEQQEYDNAQRQKARENNVFLKYNPAIKAQVEQFLAQKRTRVKQYPRFYQPHDTVDLNKVELANDDPLLKHHSPLFQIGRVLRFDPPPDYESEIAPDLPVFQPQTAPKKRWHKQTMPAVSEDPYVRCLARETDPGIEVVLSSGSVSALFNMYSESWEIPVSVIQDDTTGGKKVVIIDKPLLKKKLTLREKNEIYYKTAYEHLGLCLAPETSISLPLPVRAPPAAKDQPQQPQPPKPPPAPAQVDTKEGEEAEESGGEKAEELEIDEEEGGGEDEEEEERERREKEKREAEQLEAERKAKLDEDRKNEERQREEREKRRCQALGKAGEEWMGRSFPSLADGNLIYHLWTFGDLRLLIRCKLHGYTKTPAGQKFVGTKVKLEYFGDQWEETTASETARQWTHHYIRPYDPIILVARWNVFSSRLLCTERRDIQKLLPPGTTFVPAIAAKALLVVLQKLRTLAPGQYLLTHKVEDRAVVILKAVDPSTTPQKGGSAGYDLHTSHASSGATDERTVPYVRLIWPRELSDQVPHTFPPASAPGGPGGGQQAAYSPAALAGGGPGGQQYRQIAEQLKRVKNVKYCFDYAKKGFCPRGPECHFPHLEAKTVLEISKEQRKKANKKRKAKMRQDRRQGANNSPTSSHGRHSATGGDEGSRSPVSPSSPGGGGGGEGSDDGGGHGSYDDYRDSDASGGDDVDHGLSATTATEKRVDSDLHYIATTL